MQVETQIGVMTSRSGAYAEIRISDTGLGIADSDLKNLRSVLCDKPHGMGMGLAIVRTIVEAHHGQISVEINCRVALFTIRLPVPAAISFGLNQAAALLLRCSKAVAFISLSLSRATLPPTDACRDEVKGSVMFRCGGYCLALALLMTMPSLSRHKRPTIHLLSAVRRNRRASRRRL